MGKKVNVDPDAVASFNGKLAQAQMNLIQADRAIEQCKNVAEWSDENRKQFDEMMDEAHDIIIKCLKAMDDTICDLREICDKANNIRF